MRMFEVSRILRRILRRRVTALSNTVTVGSGAPVFDLAQATPMIRAGSETGAPSKRAPVHRRLGDHATDSFARLVTPQ